MSFDDQLDALLADYQRQRENAGELQRTLSSVSCSATAPRNTVKVTVGAQGEITELTFPTKAYRRMAPKELSDAILGAAREAKEKVKAEVADLMVAQLPEGAQVRAWLDGTPDVSGMFPEEPHMSDAVREYLNRDSPKETD